MCARRVFNFLGREQEGLVLRVCTPVQTRAGSLLVEMGKPSRDLYIITEGEYRVYDDTKGEDLVLALLHRGDIFGEMSFLDGEPRSASVRAVVDGKALKMGLEELGNLKKASMDTAFDFVMGLSNVVTMRLRKANDALALAMADEEDVDHQELDRLISEMHLAVTLELDRLEES